MELDILDSIPVYVPRAQQIALLGAEAAEKTGNLAVPRLLGSALGGDGIERFPHVVDLAHVGGAQLMNVKTSVQMVDDQAILLQRDKRGLDWRR